MDRPGTNTHHGCFILIYPFEAEGRERGPQQGTWGLLSPVAAIVGYKAVTSGQLQPASSQPAASQQPLHFREGKGAACCLRLARANRRLELAFQYPRPQPGAAEQPGRSVLRGRAAGRLGQAEGKALTFRNVPTPDLTPP